MQRKLFIKLVGIVCAMTTMVSLAGCTDNADIMQSSSSEKSSTSTDNIGEDNSGISNSSSPAEDVREDNYDEYIDQLGFLLNSPDWQTVMEISPANYVMWYAMFVRNQHTSDDMYMSKYLVDNKDGLFFSADEFETGIARYFDVSLEHLRSDPIIYLESEELYRTPSALETLAETSFDITNVIKSEWVTQIEFVLNIGNSSEKKVLTLEKTSNGRRYVSYVSK